MANKNIRIGGKFISNEMQKAVNYLSNSAGLTPQEFAQENEDLLKELNFGGGNIIARANIDTIERNFQTYNKKDYSFVDANTGKKVPYNEVIEIAGEYATLRGTKQTGGIIWAQLEYKINIANKQVKLNIAEIEQFIEYAKNDELDENEDFFPSIEFATYGEK